MSYSILGVWTVTQQTIVGTSDSTFTFTEQDGRIQLTITDGRMQTKPVSVTQAGNQVEIIIEIYKPVPTRVTIKATVTGDRFEGPITARFFPSGKMWGVRKAPDEVSAAPAETQYPAPIVGERPVVDVPVTPAPRPATQFTGAAPEVPAPVQFTGSAPTVPAPSTPTQFTGAAPTVPAPTPGTPVQFTSAAPTVPPPAAPIQFTGSAPTVPAPSTPTQFTGAAPGVPAPVVADGPVSTSGITRIDEYPASAQETASVPGMPPVPPAAQPADPA